MIQNILIYILKNYNFSGNFVNLYNLSENSNNYEL